LQQPARRKEVGNVMEPTKTQGPREPREPEVPVIDDPPDPGTPQVPEMPPPVPDPPDVVGSGEDTAERYYAEGWPSGWQAQPPPPTPQRRRAD
jgi:hypothetical protein